MTTHAKNANKIAGSRKNTALPIMRRFGDVSGTVPVSFLHFS